MYAQVKDDKDNLVTKRPSPLKRLASAAAPSGSTPRSKTRPSKEGRFAGAMPTAQQMEKAAAVAVHKAGVDKEMSPNPSPTPERSEGASAFLSKPTLPRTPVPAAKASAKEPASAKDTWI